MKTSNQNSYIEILIVLIVNSIPTVFRENFFLFLVWFSAILPAVFRLDTFPFSVNPMFSEYINPKTLWTFQFYSEQKNANPILIPIFTPKTLTYLVGLNLSDPKNHQIVRTIVLTSYRVFFNGKTNFDDRNILVYRASGNWQGPSEPLLKRQLLFTIPAVSKESESESR